MRARLLLPFLPLPAGLARAEPDADRLGAALGDPRGTSATLFRSAPGGRPPLTQEMDIE